MPRVRERDDVKRPSVPVEEWTDDEWLAVLRTVPPDADVSVGEQAVAEMRGADDPVCGKGQ